MHFKQHAAIYQITQIQYLIFECLSVTQSIKTVP